jgi:WhiB family redox-sensing transcriptional regulator
MSLQEAACKDKDVNIFFPSPETAAAINIAKAICKTCSVKNECLAKAIEGNEQGIWGGLTQGERTNLNRRLRRKSVRLSK